MPTASGTRRRSTRSRRYLRTSRWRSESATPAPEITNRSGIAQVVKMSKGTTSHEWTVAFFTCHSHGSKKRAVWKTKTPAMAPRRSQSSSTLRSGNATRSGTRTTLGITVPGPAVARGSALMARSIRLRRLPFFDLPHAVSGRAAPDPPMAVIRESCRIRSTASTTCTRGTARPARDGGGPRGTALHVQRIGFKAAVVRP